jgi:hypothetical protein
MKVLSDKLGKKLEEARALLLTHRKDKVEKLEKLSEEIRRGFEERIIKLYQRRNLIARALKNKLRMKEWRIGVFNSIFHSRPWIIFKFALGVPFIYGVFVPAVIFHFFLEAYHQVAFRLYGIPRVKPGEYFVFDRALLSYLNWLEKINCLYCSYVNCLISYAQEIGGRTERFWCPIKHARKSKGTHSQYPDFVGYLDAEEFHKKRTELRDFSREKLIVEGQGEIRNKPDSE